jgi:hypothetical protein
MSSSLSGQCPLLFRDRSITIFAPLPEPLGGMTPELGTFDRQELS